MSFIIDYEQGAQWTNQRTTTLNNLTVQMRCKNLNLTAFTKNTPKC